jgi:hypothetical protein
MPGPSQPTTNRSSRRISCIHSIFISSPISVQYPSLVDTKSSHAIVVPLPSQHYGRPRHGLDHCVPSAATPTAASAAADGGDASSSMDVGGVGDPSSGFFPLGFPGRLGTSGQVVDSCRPVVSETAPKSARQSPQKRVSAHGKNRARDPC